MPDSHGSWHPESDRVRPERDVGRVEKNYMGNSHTTHSSRPGYGAIHTCIWF